MSDGFQLVEVGIFSGWSVLLREWVVVIMFETPVYLILLKRIDVSPGCLEWQAGTRVLPTPCAWVNIRNVIKKLWLKLV